MYNDQKYIDDFLNTGHYPKIHDNIFTLIAQLKDECSSVLDIGCSIGLLTARCHDIYPVCVGIEPFKPDFGRIIKDKAIYLNVDASLHNLGEIIRRYKTDLIICRRVLPEICNAVGTEGVKQIIELFHILKVKYVVLEGRVYSKRSNHTLCNLQKELQLFNGFYQLVKQYKNCAIMRIL